MRNISPDIALDGGGTTNAVTYMEYDANCNVWKVTDPVTYAEYEDSAPDSRKTVNAYDYRNRLVDTQTPLVYDADEDENAQPIVITVYDIVGNVISVTDAESNNATNFYDANNRMIITWAPEVDVYVDAATSVSNRPGTTNTLNLQTEYPVPSSTSSYGFICSSPLISKE